MRHAQKPLVAVAYTLFLLGTLTQFQVAAAPSSGSDFLDLLDQENKVFAAARYTQTLAETPANVSILSRDDIARFGYRTIGEALSSLPGFYNAASQWPAQGLRGTAVPGDFGSRILYMINGMPIYEPTYGGFFIEYLDIASIERIEVVRGSGSALYGNGAVLGIINLVTHNGHDAPGKNISLEAASHNTYKLYGSYSGVTQGGIDSFLSMSLTDSQGRDISLAEYGATSSGNDGLQNMRFFGRLSGQEAWLQWNYVDADKRDPLASYGTFFNSDKLRLRERFGSVETGINKKLDNGALITGRAYYFDVSERGDYPYSNTSPATTLDYINVTDISSRSFGAEVRYDQFVGERHHVLSGVEVKRVLDRYEVGNQPGPTRSGLIEAIGTPSYSQYSLFVQDEWRLDEKRKLVLGARYDYYDNFSNGVKGHLSPRIAYVHDFGGGDTGKLLFGEAFRAPTIYESLYTDATPSGNVTLWPNPNLKPEITRTLEAIWEREPVKGFNWNVGTYIVQSRNSPVQVAVDNYGGQSCPVSGGCNQYQNSNTTHRIVGLESGLKLKREDGLNAYASATLQKGTQTSNGAELASSPRYLAKGGLSHPLPWQGWKGSLEANLVGSAKGRINADGTRTASTPSYVLLNASISTESLGDAWKVSLRVNNLLNKTTYTVASRELQPLERVPADGRTFSLLIKKTF